MDQPRPVLIADIGGTNSRFAIVEPGSETPALVRAFENRLYPALDDAIATYLADAGIRPSRAVMAIAGPMRDGRVHLTNRPSWSFEPPALAARVDMSDIRVINDFAALAWALPSLRAEDVTPIGAAPPPHAGRPRVVLGPGTGLGVAAAVPVGAAWHAVPSEAGHVEFSATTPREAEVYAQIRRLRGRVSAEFVVSGRGLVQLDQAIAAVDGRTDPGRDAGAVADAARAGDAAAREAVDLFFAALARFSGDMALAFLAQDGVFLFGGVVQRMSDLIDHAAFRASFEAKAPHEDLARSIGSSLITAPHLALRGCAVLAVLAHEA